MHEPFKYAPASIDWRNVDWSQTDEQIAEKMGLDVGLVRAGRLLYGPTLAPGEIEVSGASRRDGCG